MNLLRFIMKKVSARNYDRERENKVDKRTHLIGNPFILLLIWIAWVYFVAWLSCYATIAFKTLSDWVNSPESQAAMHAGKLVGFDTVENAWKNFNNLGNFQTALITSKTLFLFLTSLMSLMVIPIFLKIYAKHKSTNYNQYGNDRFATIAEVLWQYPQVPDKGYEFSGKGGIPIMHIKPTNWTFIRIHPILFMKYWLLPVIPYTLSKLPLSINLKARLSEREPVKGFYAIDNTKTSTMIIGISRSGKGETLVMPLIDILSRAKEKVSMVVNDLKGELYQMSYFTLRRRGYDVRVINLDELNFSDSYNPLEMVIKYAKEGYYDKTQKAANTFSSSIYTDPNAKDKFWQNSSINLLNSLILATIDYAQRNNRWDQITMDNVLHMMTDLGGKEVMLDKDNNIVTNPKLAVETKNKLTVYFMKLRELNEKQYSDFRQMALDSFAQSKFAGEETAGNIYSSAMEGIKLYQQADIAKMTSLNSVNLENLGFPRVLKVKFPDKFKFSTAIVEFIDSNSTIEKKTIIVDELGNISCPIRTKLPDKFTIKISFNFYKNNPELKDKSVILDATKIYRKKSFGKHKYLIDKYTGKPILKTIRLKISNSNLGKENDKKIDLIDFKLNYSEKPVALFFVTPPNNPAYNQLATFAIDQVFNVNYELASANAGECVTPIHNILDEFGNLNTIPNLDTKVTMGLGSKIHFHFVVQNLEQLELHYSKQQAATIQSNCANLLYILTNSETTAKFISNQIGKRTVETNTKNGKALDPNSNSYNNGLISQDLMTPPELTRLMGGEMIVLRSVYRQDQQGNDVSAYPIFDHNKTKMPYRYTFLNHEFDSNTKLSDVAIKSKHRDINLKKLRIEYDEAYNDLIKLLGKDREKATPTGTDAILSTLNNRIGEVVTERKAVFTEEELVNNDLLKNAANRLYQFARRISDSPVDPMLLGNANEFWRKNNSWEKVTGILNNDNLLINQFQASIIKDRKIIQDRKETTNA